MRSSTPVGAAVEWDGKTESSIGIFRQKVQETENLTMSHPQQRFIEAISPPLSPEAYRSDGSRAESHSR